MGKLLVILGIDGAGKTTTLDKIHKILDERNISHVVLERKQLLNEEIVDNPSPYVKKYMKKFGELLWGARKEDTVKDISDEGWLYMHALWYNIFEHHILNPLLDKYEYVILDSWFYKISARFKANQFSEEILDIVFKNLSKGDKGIMLDTNPKICHARKEHFSHGELGAHNECLDHLQTEQEKFLIHQEKVRKELKFICDNNNWEVINTDDGINNEKCLEIIRKLNIYI